MVVQHSDSAPEHLLSQVLEKKRLTVTSLRQVTLIAKVTRRLRKLYSHNDFDYRKRKRSRSSEGNPIQMDGQQKPKKQRKTLKKRGRWLVIPHHNLTVKTQSPSWLLLLRSTGKKTHITRIQTQISRIILQKETTTVKNK